MPIWEKYTLTIEEAAKYFRIGESKLRKLAEENPVPDWVMMNGNRIQIKRKQFEKWLIRWTQSDSEIEPWMWYNIVKHIKALSIMERSITMSEKRRDNKNRILRTGESQRKDGRYAYKYIDTFGKPQFVYSWKLVPTDKPRQESATI